MSMGARFYLGGLLFLVGCATTDTGPSSATSLPPVDGDPSGLIGVADLPALIKKIDGGQLMALARQTDCPCPSERGSLEDCATRCGLARFALRSIVRQLARKVPVLRIQSRLVERFTPRDAETINLANAPCRGPKEAGVTLVVFSDFQCPFCQRSTKLVEQLALKLGPKLRICFKNLVVHASARGAARAGIAAHRQGKFWPFHDLLFSHMRAQEQDDLEAYAQQLGLDVARFKTDMQDGRTQTLLLADGMEARRLRIRGTPAFFINGRPMSDPKTVEFFMDWVEEASSVRGKPSPRPASKPHARPASKPHARPASEPTL